MLQTPRHIPPRRPKPEKLIALGAALSLAALTLCAMEATAQKPSISHAVGGAGIFQTAENIASHAKTGNAGPSGSNAPRSFTVLETYRQHATPQPADPTMPGVVGLDLLVRTDAYPTVQGVFPGTPAHKQGIRPGDILVAVNGEKTLHKDLTTLDAMISDVPGDMVRLSVLRGGQLKQVSLTVVSLADLSRELQASFSSMGPTP